MSLKKQAAAAILAATIAMPAAHAEGFFSGALSAINSTTPAGLMDEPERTPGVEGWFRDTGSGFSRILREGSTAIVLPLYTEHPRWDYDNRSQENAYPFGSGIARIMVDSRGNERLAYAIAFSDSHYKPEPFLLSKVQQIASPDFPTIHPGLIVTGDWFVDSKEKMRSIVSLFPDAIAVDMESAAIAQTCHIYKVPFISFRVVSDIPLRDTDASQYHDFWGRIAENSFHVTKAFVDAIKNQSL